MKSDSDSLNLVGRYLDGQTSAEEVARLEKRMLEEPQLRAEFLACSRVDAALRNAVGGASLEVLKSPPAAKRWREWRSPLAAAAAAVIGIFFWHLVFDGRPEVIAHFGELESCRWMSPSAKLATGDAIVPGERIELSAGRAELHFETGARVTVFGPAIFEARSRNGGFLILGEVYLAAETAESKGFVLETPTSKFVDIGTAFSAGVSVDGLSRLDVSKGIVDVVLEGLEEPHRLTAGETMFVEPGEKKILTRIEGGDGTPAFRFSTIPPPSHDDYADGSQGHASVRVTSGTLGRDAGRLGGTAAVLLDGAGQSNQDSPRESAYFSPEDHGAFVIDLGKAMAVRRIHSYSWHQNEVIPEHRERARQRFTLYGYAGEEPPVPKLPPDQAGWTRIARVNTDESLHVQKRLDRPSQQACAITAEDGDIGHFRYLLWEVKGGTFYGEIDVFGEP